MNLGPGVKVYVESWRGFAAHAIDGPCEGDYFRVVVELRDGKRMAHKHTLKGFEIVCNEDTDGEVIFSGCPEAAHVNALKLASRVRAKGQIIPEYWMPISSRFHGQP